MAGPLEARLAEIIADRAGVEVGEVSPEVHVLSDLGLDSVAFLDVTYDIDREFKISLPVERWMEQVNAGEAKLADFFVFKNLVSHVSALVRQ